jgi:hypothetical protein
MGCRAIWRDVHNILSATNNSHHGEGNDRYDSQMDNTPNSYSKIVLEIAILSEDICALPQSLLAYAVTVR